MKSCEICNEWNLGVLGNPQSEFSLERLIDEPPIGILLDKIYVYMNDYTYENLCYYILKKDGQIIGHIRLEFVCDNIWQVKESNIKTPQQGVGSELYHFIIKFGGIKNSKKLPPKRLINDTQLSTSAEHIWLKSLPKKGIDMKIFDKQLNKIYNIGEIGSLTSDNRLIIHPQQDTSDITVDFDYSNIRFFLLAETTRNTNHHLTEHQQKWINFRQRYLNNEPFDELYEDAINNNVSTGTVFGVISYIQ